MNYNVNTIQSNYLTVCKFQQPVNPQFPTLSSNLTTGSSGITYNDGEIPYLTLENIKDLGFDYNRYFFNEYNSGTTYIVDNRVKYEYPAYASSNNYVIGERIVYDNVGYESLVAGNTGNQPDLNFDKWQVLNETYTIYDSLVDVNVGNQPDLNSTQWNEIDLFNAFLENRVKYAATNVLQKVIENKNRILEQKRLYFGAGNGTVTIENDTQWAGIKIDFVRNQNIKLKINRIALHFTGAETDLTFYVYNQNTQQTTFTASCVSNDLIWIDVSDIEMTTDKEGAWFLFYKRADLNEKAINNELQIPVNFSNFVKFNQFEVVADTDLKTITQGNFTYTQSNIANIDYSIVPDLTQWLVYNKNIFATALKYQFATDVYTMFASNEHKRVNNSERNIDINAVKAQIYSDDNKMIVNKLNEEIQKLRDSIGKAKIDNINLPTKGFLYNSINDL